DIVGHHIFSSSSLGSFGTLFVLITNSSITGFQFFVNSSLVSSVSLPMPVLVLYFCLRAWLELHNSSSISLIRLKSPLGSKIRHLAFDFIIISSMSLPTKNDFPEPD